MSELKACPFCQGAAFPRKNPKFCGCVNVGCFMVEVSVSPKEWNARASATRPAPERHNELREALEICRKFAEAMELAMTKPHPVTGKVNFIAECKADAARHLEREIAALTEQAASVATDGT